MNAKICNPNKSRFALSCCHIFANKQIIFTKLIHVFHFTLWKDCWKTFQSLSRMPVGHLVSCTVLLLLPPLKCACAKLQKELSSYTDIEWHLTHLHITAHERDLKIKLSYAHLQWVWFWRERPRLEAKGAWRAKAIETQSCVRSFVVDSIEIMTCVSVRCFIGISELYESLFHVHWDALVVTHFYLIVVQRKMNANRCTNRTHVLICMNSCDLQSTLANARRPCTGSHKWESLTAVCKW